MVNTKTCLLSSLLLCYSPRCKVILPVLLLLLLLYALHFLSQSRLPVSQNYQMGIQINSLDIHHQSPELQAYDPQLLHDISREVTLTLAARDLGIAPDQRSKFAQLCSMYTPINFCAEHARLAELEVCTEGRCAQQTDMNSLIQKSELGMTKDDVEESIRNAVGLIEYHDLLGQYPLNENEVLFKPLSRATLGLSGNVSKRTVDITSTTTLEKSTRIPGEQPNNEDYVRIMNFHENTEFRALYNSETFFEGRKDHDTISTDQKKIILWYAPTRYWPTTPGLNELRGCPDLPCLVTTDKKYAKNSSAMIFAGELAPQWPPSRRPDQIFVFHNHEPPHQFWMANSSPAWLTAFNWTMSYRHDSDIVRPYGLIRRKQVDRVSDPDENPSAEEYAAVLKRKTKTAAVLISNCGAASRRDEYIRELSKYISVDVYGACGNKECPRDKDVECFREINSNYKFFLAFESAFCEDYITEKLFRYFNMDLIVVARGSNQYYIHAPKETFINTVDFKSPKLLAERLNYLDRHPEEYIKILEAKNQYVALFQDYPILNTMGTAKHHHYAHEIGPMCQMCQRLWNLDTYGKIVPDIKTWFEKRMCKSKEEVHDLGDV